MADPIKLLSTIGIKVKINNVLIAKATSFGDIGAEPSRIDATSLADTVRVNILGVQEYDSWTLEYLYNDTDRATLQAAETASKVTPVAVEVELPNGDKYANTAEVSAYVAGGGVNEALRGTASCALQGAWEFTAHA